MFKYPPLLGDDEKINIGIKIPPRCREIIKEVGGGSCSIGVRIIVTTFEKKILQFIEKRKDKVSKKTNKKSNKNTK